MKCRLVLSAECKNMGEPLKHDVKWWKQDKINKNYTP